MISSIAILVIAFFSIAIDYAFVRQKQDRKLFKMYRLRDELALEAMKNPEIQHQEEYICLNKLICKEIMLLRDSIPLVQIIREYKKITEEDKQESEKIIERIQSDTRYKHIYDESSKIFEEQIDKHIRWFGFFVISPFVFILEGIIKLINHENAPTKEIKKKKVKIYKLKFTAEIVPNAYKQFARF